MFRVYYADGSYYEGPIAGITRGDYQVVAEIREDGGHAHFGGSWCCWDGEFWGSQGRPKGLVNLEGSLLSNVGFHAIKVEAFAWLLSN
jgi:hypothetical protein